MLCENCDAVFINGCFCHEHGCPTSHVGAIRECKECGSAFLPESQNQVCCSQSCWLYYNGLDGADILELSS